MRLKFVLVICLVLSFVKADDLLIADFETANQNYTLPNGGVVSATDYFTRTYNGDPSITHDVLGNVQGTYFIAGRDIATVLGDGVSGQVLLSDINVSAYSGLQVKCLLAAPDVRFDSILGAGLNADWIIGEYSYDGSNWTKFAQFTGPVADESAEGALKEDTDFDGLGDGTALTETFQEFTYNIPDGGTTLKIRFLLMTDSGTEDVSIDNVRVSGTSAGPPDAPDNLITVSVTSSEADISWDAVTGATYYHIYRSTDPYSGFTQINTTTGTSYQDTGVSAGNKYFYYVTADNSK